MNEMSHRVSDTPGIVSSGVSHAADPELAVREALAGLKVDKTCFLLVFIPDCLDVSEVSEALNEQVPTTSVFGCTTAGQITPLGYENNALLIVSFPREHFRCSSTLITPLKPVSIEQTANEARRLAARFQKTANWNRLALLITDGLSKQEDVLVAALEAGLEDIPVFGGSAGNGLAFAETYVLHHGQVHSNAAMLILIETDLSFTGLGFDHFLPTDKRMVVTKAIPEERLVLEINGSPAAEEYARLVGHRIENLSPQIFAANPVLVRNNNAWHVRAIQEVIENNGLSFLSAIDDGLLLTLGKGQEILRTLDTSLTLSANDGSAPEVILGFDCVLRKLEIEENRILPQASELLRKHRVLGFNTYGEQHCGVHVNQTFVGVAFFRAKQGAMF